MFVWTVAPRCPGRPKSKEFVRDSEESGTVGGGGVLA